MFTGIVEDVGRIVRLEKRAELVELDCEVRAATAEGVGVGDSVALNGCCLTVTRVAGTTLSFQAVPETLSHTSLGDRVVGDPINVERAMRATDRFDGHIVQGHVDGTGTVAALDRAGDDVRLRIDCEPAIAELLVPKGSVTLDGVSLTVVDPDAHGFSVALIPHTLSVTTLADRIVGDRANLEVDVIGKYVHQFLTRFRNPK